MNCRNIEQYLDDYLDGDMDAGKRADYEKHAATCITCREKVQQALALQSALRNLPAPMPSPQFFEQAMSKAVRQNSTRRWRLGPALAAGLALLMVAGLMWQQLSFHDRELPAITMTLQETRDVKLVFHAETKMQNARLILELPGNVRIRGYSKQRTIAWYTDIQAGENILRLPLEAVATAENRLIARIEHGGKSKSFSVLITVDDARTLRQLQMEPMIS